MGLNALALIKVLIVLAFLVSFIVSNDYYTLLGISRDASQKDMKTAYRKLSAKYHPDKNPGDKEAQDLFIKLTKAYETLTDPEKKKIYDVYGEQGLDKENQLSNQNKQKGQNAYVEIDVTLDELYNGVKKSLNVQKDVVCSQCHGTGGKLGQTKTCPKCNGRGQVVEQVDTGMGFHFQMQNVCKQCAGKGIIFKETCPHCRGKKVVKEEKNLVVEVEKGMKHLEKIIFRGESEQHPDTSPGDLIVTLKQSNHHFFTGREGDDLHATLSLSLKEGLLGYNRNFKSLDNRNVSVQSNNPTQPFEVKTIANEGMPVHNYSSNKGVLFLKHVIRLPSSLTDAEKILIKQMFE